MEINSSDLSRPVVSTHDAKFGTLMTLKITFTNYELVLIELTKSNCTGKPNMYIKAKCISRIFCEFSVGSNLNSMYPNNEMF